jgi:hypothetical protein
MTRKTGETKAPQAASANDAAPDVSVDAQEAIEATVVERAETTVEATAEGRPALSEAIREGAGDARAAAARVFGSAGQALHKGVYGGFYYLTYGVVFGALAVGRLIPTHSAMGEGVHDGYLAARKAFEEKEAGEAAAATEAVPV